MRIRMKLISDTIFGNGMSVPGGEDISVLHDVQGFPYYRGSTFKGIFRETLIQYLDWIDYKDPESVNIVNELLGTSDENRMDSDKLGFSDFCISESVRGIVLEEIGEDPAAVLDMFTHIRTFTSLNENGVAQKGSLRTARCVNKGTILESDIICGDKNSRWVKEVLPMIKWVGTMRNRGFGKVQIEIKEA